MTMLNNPQSPSGDPKQGFDPHNPPDPTLIDACVHCGFCLTTCPSYRVIGKETDSPRGRIYQMDAINEGLIDLSPATVSHFDSCLGCLACVSACPSGVQYDKLIEATRSQVQRQHPRSWSEVLVRTLIFNLFPYPNRLRPLLLPFLLYQKSGLQSLIRRSQILSKWLPQLGAMESILPQLTLDNLIPESFPTRIAASGSTRFRVGVILGCVQRLFAPEVNQATVQVLTANGCEVVIPPVQGCCGALSHHQGCEDQALTFARRLIDTFEDFDLDAILINASGCGHTLKEYGRLLADDPKYAAKAEAFTAKVKDIQEFLADVGLTAELHPLKANGETLTLVYQDACHMLHGQKISLQPRQLLKQIPNTKLREPVDAALCCGSAGVYNILQPDVGEALGQQKITNLLNTKAEVIVSSNIGCRTQLLKHLEQSEQPHHLLPQAPLLHPMELLDRSIRNLPLDQSVGELKA